jgi:hypothetical protein
MVCDHPNQIIALQKQVTDMQTRQFLPPPLCDPTTSERQIRQLRDDLDEARRTPRTVRSDEDLRRELDDMTQNAQKASEETWNLKT